MPVMRAVFAILAALRGKADRPWSSSRPAFRGARPDAARLGAGRAVAPGPCDGRGYTPRPTNESRRTEGPGGRPSRGGRPRSVSPARATTAILPPPALSPEAAFRRHRPKERGMFKSLGRIVRRATRLRGPSAADRAFVVQTYLDLLRRRPDAEGLWRWSDQLAHGMTRAEMVRAIKASPEYRGKHKPLSAEEVNYVLPDYWKRPVYARLIAARVAANRVVLLARQEQFAALQPALSQAGKQADGVPWDWDPEVDLSAYPGDAPVLVCEVPVYERQWRVVQRLKQ